MESYLHESKPYLEPKRKGNSQAWTEITDSFLVHSKVSSCSKNVRQLREKVMEAIADFRERHPKYMKNRTVEKIYTPFDQLLYNMVIETDENSQGALEGTFKFDLVFDEPKGSKAHDATTQECDTIQPRADCENANMSDDEEFKNAVKAAMEGMNVGPPMTPTNNSPLRRTWTSNKKFKSTHGSLTDKLACESVDRASVLLPHNNEHSREMNVLVEPDEDIASSHEFHAVSISSLHHVIDDIADATNGDQSEKLQQSILAVVNECTPLTDLQSVDDNELRNIDVATAVDSTKPKSDEVSLLEAQAKIKIAEAVQAWAYSSKEMIASLKQLMEILTKDK
jgi:hypothetical protein